jgi:hypothetical protein
VDGESRFAVRLCALELVELRLHEVLLDLGFGDCVDLIADLAVGILAQVRGDG